MRHSSNPAEVRKIAVDLPKFLEKWAGRSASVAMFQSAVTFDGVVLPGRVEHIIINTQWHYAGSIVVRTPDEDIEVDFLDIAGARPFP